MIFRLIIGILILILAIIAIRALSRISPLMIKKIIKLILFVFAIGITLFLIRFGMPYIGIIFGAIAALIPWMFRHIPQLLRFLYIFRSAKSFFGNAKNKHENKAHNNNMSTKEAREILGVPENATKKEIKSAYQKLMKQCHPDKGGSTYLSSQINKAKEVLLKD
ncbi:DnaJ domain-containing protein [Rickettsiales bacterium]|nr:DnaJ domain-containing protein [Rickettsiales bacterium]